MPSQISLNYSGVMETVIGPRGMTEAEFDDLIPALSSAKAAVLDQYKGGDLAWMGLPFTGEFATDAADFWAGCRGEYDNFVLLGIGGSALGASALLNALKPPFWNLRPPEARDGARLFVLDNVDPEKLAVLLDLLPPESTLFNVVTKSGSTAETIAQFMAVLPFLKKRLGDDWRKHLVITTDPVKGAMRRFAETEGIRSFPVPDGVGGRFSVLSPVGLLPAAALNLDIHALLQGARDMFEHFEKEESPASSLPLLLAGILHWADSRKGYHIHVMMPYCDRLLGFADWFRQLWAESLGKAVDRKGTKVNCGPTPVKALGTTDQHSQVQLYMEGPFDKLIVTVESEKPAADIEMGPQPLEEQSFTYLQGKSMWSLLKAEALGTRIALLKAGRPALALSVPEVNEYTVGQFIYCWELVTAVAGELYDINAFNQPGVEAGKIAAYALMGREGFEETAKDIEALKVKMEQRYSIP